MLGILSTVGAFAKNLLKNTIGKWIGNGLKKLIGNVGSTAASGIGGAIGTAFSNSLVNNQLTGKEREQNEFNAEQSEVQRQFATNERLASQEFNEAQAQKQMDFQEYMASTQYQRSVADMQAAGVNPALAIGGIQGASASGAMAQSSPASGSAASGSASLQGLSEVLEFARIKAEIERIEAETDKTKADTEGQNIDNDIRSKYGEITAKASYNEILAAIDKMKSEEALNKYQKDTLGPLEEAIKKASEKNLSAEAAINEWRAAYMDKYDSDPQAPILQQTLTSLLEWLNGGRPSREERRKKVQERRGQMSYDRNYTPRGGYEFPF